MTNEQLIAEWRENHPHSMYDVPDGRRCDACERAITSAEQWRNIVENEEQDGNSVLCDRCSMEIIASSTHGK